MKTVIRAFKEIHRLERRLIPSIIALAICTAVSPFVNIWMSARIIDELETTRRVKMLVIYVVSALLLNFILFMVRNVINEFYYSVRNLMYQRELQEIMNKMLYADFRLLEDADFRELVHKHNEAQDRVFSAFVQLSWMLMSLVNGVLTMGISIWLIFPLLKIGFMRTGDTFFERPVFLVMLIAAVIAMGIIMLIISSSVSKLYFKAGDDYSRLDRIFEFYNNMLKNYKTGKEVRLYHEQPLIEKEATEKLLTDGEKILRKASSRLAHSSSVMVVLGAILGFGIYLFIGVKGLYGLFSIGSLVLYSGSFLQIVSGVSSISMTLGKTNEFLPLIKYYFKILETENEMQYGDKEIDTDSMEIEFKNVSFKYPSAEEYTLKNVNLKIRNGEHFAVVGKNGSGKTTFIKLLCRLYDATDGEVLINGINIKEYSKDSIIRLFSVVFQDFRIFALTVRENVISDSEHSPERLEEVLRSSDVYERIERMSNKEGTYLFKTLKKDGVEISGGEQQKLALARALYKDSPIVILDEPTASLDPVAESKVYENFNNFAENKTAIYISHRLSSCVFCDKIAVFDNGMLVQDGTHEELIADTDGRYYELWTAQAQYYLDK